MDILKSISINLASTERNSGPTLTDNNIIVTGYKNNQKDTHELSDFRQKITIIGRNLTKAELYEYALKEYNTLIAENGALLIYSGAKTGRSRLDKRIVKTDPEIWCDKCSPNIPMSPSTFLINRETATNYLNMQDRLFVFDGYAGWDYQYRIKIMCTE